MSSHLGSSGSEQASSGNSLGLTQRDLRALLDKLDGDPSNPDESRSMVDTGRTYARHNFRLNAVNVEIMHAEQADTVASTIRVAARNISAGGVGLLHRGFVHLGTQVRVHLPLAKQGLTPVPGGVRRCQHISGVAHELGVQFDENIDLDEVSWLDLSYAWHTYDKVRAHELSGTVLYADASRLAQMRFLDVIRGTRLTASKVSDAEEALRAMIKGVDVALIAGDLGQDRADSLFHAARHLELTTPMIYVTDNVDQTALRDRLVALRPDSFVRKPLEKATLLRAIAEFVAKPPEADGHTDIDAA
ncbi:MAG: PilZ domain-containing protein [Planctomycetota bacterium]